MASTFNSFEDETVLRPNSPLPSSPPLSIPLRMKPQAIPIIGTFGHLAFNSFEDETRTYLFIILIPSLFSFNSFEDETINKPDTRHSRVQAFNSFEDETP